MALQVTSSNSVRADQSPGLLVVGLHQQTVPSFKSVPLMQPNAIGMAPLMMPTKNATKMMPVTIKSPYAAFSYSEVDY